MRKALSILALSAALLALAACGGSGDPFEGSGSSSSSSASTSSSAKSITLISTSPQIPSDNSTPATITAIITDASNAVVVGTPVAFSTSSGVIAPTATSAAGSTPGVSDSNGEAAATLTTPGDPSDRNITITATVGTVSATIIVQVVGTKLTVSGPTSLIEGSNGTFSASLIDSGGNGISGKTIDISSASGNTLSASNLTTDSSGHVTFTLTATKAGNDTVSVMALGQTATQALSVSSQTFSITAPAQNATIDINATQSVTVTWTNNGAPVANQAVSVSTTRGLFTGNTSTITATTNGSGIATVAISSATAGPAVITATGSGVSAQLTVEFIATTPATIDLQASPATIQTSGSSTITAIVWDAQSNLVEGQTVDFQLTDKTGGTISVASAVTDSQGRAQTVYTATDTASSSNGVVVTATVQGTSIETSTSLTVGGQTVFLSLGTGDKITEQNNQTQFVLTYAVQALDASGNAITGVPVSITIHSFPYADVPPSDIGADGSAPFGFAAYGKGAWAAIGTQAAAQCNGISGTAWCQIIAATCFNEDVNGSGILLSPSEDINGNGKLDPGDVASVTPGTVTTDSTGTATFSVVYPEDHAGWVQVLLTASATVSGTQSSTSTKFWLPILASYAAGTASPPGAVSPYGGANTCTDPN